MWWCCRCIMTFCYCTLGPYVFWYRILSSPEHISSSSSSGYRPPRRRESVMTLGISGLQRRLDCCATRLRLGAASGAFVQKRYKPTLKISNFDTCINLSTPTSILRTGNNVNHYRCSHALWGHGDILTNAALHQRSSKIFSHIYPSAATCGKRSRG